MKIDFGREEGGKFLPVGKHIVKIKDVKVEPDPNSDHTLIIWTFEGTGMYKGGTHTERTSTDPRRLRFLRQIIEAATGQSLAGRSITFNPAKMKGRMLEITIEIREGTGKHAGKQFHNMTGCAPATAEQSDPDGLDNDDDDDIGAGDITDDDLDEVPF